MPKLPSKVYSCTECETTFVGHNVEFEGKLGKRCPNGHFSSLSALRKPVKNKFVADNQLAMKPSAHESKVTETERKLLDTFGTPKLPLRSYGIVGRIQELELALQLMLDTYERYGHTVAPSPKLSALFEGAFAANAELARRILHK